MVNYKEMLELLMLFAKAYLGVGLMLSFVGYVWYGIWTSLVA